MARTISRNVWDRLTPVLIGSAIIAAAATLVGNSISAAGNSKSIEANAKDIGAIQGRNTEDRQRMLRIETKIDALLSHVKQ